MILIRNADDSHDPDEDLRMEHFFSKCAAHNASAWEAGG
jgi:hypothetical protein